MIGMTNSGNGSGISLRVRNGTLVNRPASASENTVYVVTETSIPRWTVQYSNPSSPSAGDVWIGIGWDRTSEFNIIRRNGVYIQIVSCAQYINSTWVSKDAYIYQNNAWRQFSDTYHPLIKTMTGETTFTTQIVPPQEPVFKLGNGDDAPTSGDFYGVYTQAAGVHIYSRVTSATYNPVKFYFTQPFSINGNVNTLRVVWNGEGSGNAESVDSRFGLISEIGGDWVISYREPSHSAFPRKTTDLDISAIAPGNYYFQATAKGYIYDGNRRPSSVWIEDVQFLNVTT